MSDDNNQQQSFVSTQTFGTVMTVLVSAALALNGFQWSNIQALREQNITLQGEIQTLNARVLPVSEAITRETFDINRDRQDENISRLRDSTQEDIERIRGQNLELAKKLTALCAVVPDHPFDCGE